MFRIAIVGLGPKGLYCLESLNQCLDTAQHSVRFQIHIFEPQPHPGSGPVYDPDQPHYFRMNFANEHVDMWSRTAASGGDRPTLLEWMKQNEMGDATPEAYASRRVVGEYLHAGYQAVIADLGQKADVQIRAELVDEIQREADGWALRTDRSFVHVDEVLLATGHDSQRQEPVPESAIETIYREPGIAQLAAIDSRSSVAIRGFGLTSIDAVLALTEGRGARFESAPGRFLYQQSENSARTILPYSRTGRPMIPKPDGLRFRGESGLDALWDASRQRLDTDPSDNATLLDHVREVLVDASSTALSMYGRLRRTKANQEISRALDDVLSRRRAEPEEIRRAMEAHLDVAYGLSSPDAYWALGAAWRGIYPSLVGLVAERRLDRPWAAFARLAVEMERLAFGPPAENAARLLALVEAGVIDLRHATSPDVTSTQSGFTMTSVDQHRDVDVLINAVIAPAGIGIAPAPVISSLLSQKVIRSQNAGVEVTEDGNVVGIDGHPVAGLSAVGRPTEGSVLGNDTLNRSLHRIPEEWARRVVQVARTKVGIAQCPR